MSSKTSKQGTATINMSFEVGGVDELQRLINRLMAVNSVIDIERSNGLNNDVMHRLQAGYWPCLFYVALTGRLAARLKRKDR